MSKQSTPIAQLPIHASRNGPDPSGNVGFIGNPPSSQVGEQNNDDDATINEVMSHFGSQAAASQPQLQQPQQPYIPQPSQAPHPTQHVHYQSQGTHDGGLYGASPYAPPMSGWASGWSEDIKNVVVMTILVFLVLTTPVASWFTRYLPIDRIPFSEVAVKALLAALAIAATRKYIIN